MLGPINKLNRRDFDRLGRDADREKLLGAFAELEARAERALPPSVLSYVAGGAGSEHTQRANVSAFAQWGLIPRMLVGAARRGRVETCLQGGVQRVHQGGMHQERTRDARAEDRA